MAMTEEITPAPVKARNGKRTPKPKSLATKLSEVMGAIHHLEKTAVADMGNFSFKFVEEHQILEAVREELASRHVIIIPEITDIVKEGQFTTLKMLFHIHDGDSGEIITSAWAAHAADSRDFGASKCCTQALKYYLLKTFLLPTWERPDEKSDPVRGDVENSYNRDRVIETPRTPPPAPTGEGRDASKVYVQDYEVHKGEKNGKPWIRYALTFSDGQKTSTFDDSIADCADHAHKNNLPVIVTLEPSKRNPKYTDLVELALDGGE
jgi:hypothetical protein